MTNRSNTFDDIAFAITSDVGNLANQAALLINSIRNHYPKSEIYNFVPDSSYEKLQNNIKHLFNEETIIVRDAIPVRKYPHTSLQRAFVEASRESNHEFIAALDTDTALLSKLSKPEATDSCDLFIKTVDSGEKYWGSKHSMSDWQRVYDHFGIEAPTMPSDLQSSVDNSHLISPYYQAAVVITSDHNLAPRWLEMTSESVKNNFYEHDEQRFHDQITLSVLSQKYDVGLLSNRQNCPLYARIRCPNNVELIHYVNGKRLYRHRQCAELSEIAELESFDSVLEPTDITEYYRLFYDNIRRVISYPNHHKINIPIRLARKAYDSIK